jgi:hypothetical protein
MATGKRGADVPLRPPDWVWELCDGTYKPEHEWDELLRGYQTWHETGARFGAGKGQSPDYKNWGVTLPSVAMSLRRYDEAHSGGVVRRDAKTYWTAVILASAAVVCRMRAARFVTEADAAIAFELPKAKTLLRRASRYVEKSAITKCPRFYADKLPPMPKMPVYPPCAENEEAGA